MELLAPDFILAQPQLPYIWDMNPQTDLSLHLHHSGYHINKPFPPQIKNSLLSTILHPRGNGNRQ